MGNTKLAIQRKESREGIIVSFFIAEMEHYAIPSSVRVPIGTSLMYRLELPSATTVFVALCTMQKMSYAFKTCQAHNLPDAFPPGSVGSTHLVHHKSCPPQLAAQDDVDAREFAEYILTLIEDVLEYQRKQTENLRNQMINKAVRVSLESVVESVAVHVTAQDAAEALITTDAVVTGRVASTQAPSATAVPQSSPNHRNEDLQAQKTEDTKRCRGIHYIRYCRRRKGHIHQGPFCNRCPPIPT